MEYSKGVAYCGAFFAVPARACKFAEGRCRANTRPPPVEPITSNTGLKHVFSTVWSCLRDEPAPGRSPYSIAQLATVGTDGTAKVRYVVLRRVCEDTSEITFHTDVRSAKVAEISANPSVALVVADLEKNVQIRLEEESFRHHR